MLLGCSSLDRATDASWPAMSATSLLGHLRVARRPEQFYRESIAPVLSPVDFADHQVDHARARSAPASPASADACAVNRGPLGCLVVRGEPPGPVTFAPHTCPGPAARYRRPCDGGARHPALKQALDRAFAENAAAPHRKHQ